MWFVLGARGSVGSKLPVEPVLMDVAATKRIQAVSKAMTDENTKYKF